MALVKYNNNSLSSVTSAPNFPAGAMTHIKTLTASSSSTLSFVNGSSDVVFDSTYPIYVFKFINIHPATNDAAFTFNGSTDTGSNYNVTKSSSSFNAYHRENGSESGVVYQSGHDLSQGTGFQKLSTGIGNDADDNGSGSFFIFNPSSTTFAKHFLVNSNRSSGTFVVNDHIGGYMNTTSAIDAIQFKMSSGNIDSGTIKLYVIKDS